MEMLDGTVPAWMLCGDMLTRFRDEFVLEAIDILHVEMDAGRIDVSGYISLLPDKPDEIQRDMYIIRNLIEKEGEIMSQYRPYIGEVIESDPAKMKRIEDLRKFVLSVNAISMLMGFSHVLERWAADTGQYCGTDDMGLIISDTLKAAGDRAEVLEFALRSSRFLKSGALDESEIRLLHSSFEECRASVS